MLAWVTLLGFAGKAPATVVFGAVFRFSAERLIGSDLAQTTLTSGTMRNELLIKSSMTHATLTYSTMQNEILTESDMTNNEVV